MHICEKSGCYKTKIGFSSLNIKFADNFPMCEVQREDFKSVIRISEHICLWQGAHTVQI